MQILKNESKKNFFFKKGIEIQKKNINFAILKKGNNIK